MAQTGRLTHRYGIYWICTMPVGLVAVFGVAERFQKQQLNPVLKRIYPPGVEDFDVWPDVGRFLAGSGPVLGRFWAGLADVGPESKIVRRPV